MEAEWIEDGGYYRVRYTGLRTYARISAMLAEVKAKAESTGVFRYFFDLRDSHEGFSIEDKYNLGADLARLFGGKFTLAAVLQKKDITGFLENVTVNRGPIRFKVTDDEALAIAFLKSP